jgi:hypothetical protein
VSQATKGPFGNSPTIAGTRTIVDQWGSSPATDDNNLLLLTKAFRSALGYHDLVNVDEANDLAHDLSAQIGTTADMSVDRDTLGTIFSQNLVSSAVARFMPPEPARGNPPPGTPEEEALHGAQRRELDKLARRLAEVNNLIDRNVTDTLDTKILVESYEFPDGDRLNVRDYDLKLGPRKLPAEGKRLIVVAEVNSVLRFRMFNEDGKKVYDGDGNIEQVSGGDGRTVLVIDQTKLNEQALRIEEIKKQLASLWPPHELTDRERDKLKTDIESIVGRAKSLKLRFAPAQVSSTGLAKETIYRLNDLQKTLDEIPSDWLHWGPKKPKDACYVGHACFCGRDCYVWVGPDSLAGLSKFTRAVLKLGSTFKDVQVVTAPSGIQFAPALTNIPR